MTDRERQAFMATTPEWSTTRHVSARAKVPLSTTRRILTTLQKRGVVEVTSIGPRGGVLLWRPADAVLA